MKDWRLIDSGPGDASYNMALDEALSLSVREGAPATLRLYGWLRPSLSIGCFQKTGDIDTGYLNESGIPLVRRPTGGRAILHGEELTYSFSSKSEGPFSGGLIETYRSLSMAFSDALRRLGIPVAMEQKREGAYAGSPLCFQSSSFGELSLNGRKLVGSAQRRWPEGFLQQGSIPYRVDRTALKKIFGSDGDAAGLMDIVPELAPGRLKEAVKEAFQVRFDVRLRPSLPSAREEALAQGLLRKYEGPEWQMRR